MVDIAPELLEKIRGHFREQLESNSKIKELYSLIQSGKATYVEADRFSELVGQALSQAFRKYLTADALPNGRLYYNIAQRVIRPMLEEDHELIATAAAQVQTNLNRAARIGIVAQRAEINEDRIDGIIDKISNAESFDDVSWVLGEPIINFSMNVVAETIRANVDLQGRAGLRPKIIRKAEWRCCDWCRALAGEYVYPDVPHDVYRRHENCRCRVLYDPADGKGKVQDVHSKQWTRSGTYDKINKNYGQLSQSNRRYLQDVVIAKSLGASAKNYDILDPETGDYFHFVEGSRIQNVEVFAGLGSKHSLRPEVADGLQEQMGGRADKWQHCKGDALIDCIDEERPAEVHWFQEETVGKVKFKVKRWLDEG